MQACSSENSTPVLDVSPRNGMCFFSYPCKVFPKKSYAKQPPPLYRTRMKRMRVRTICVSFSFPTTPASPKLSHCIFKLSPPSFLPVVDAVGALPTFSWVAPFQGMLTWLSMASICISLPIAFSGHQCPFCSCTGQAGRAQSLKSLPPLPQQLSTKNWQRWQK